MRRSHHEEIRGIVEEHGRWRDHCWNLIASENVTSPAVSALLSNDLAHRYGDYEGIDLGARKYRGNRFVIEIEKRCQELACAVFGARHADLRPLSGHIAGVAPLLALCKSEDTVMELSQECGGHRLAGKLSHCPLVQLRTLPIPFDPETFNIDVQKTLDLIEQERPRFVILGSSAFLFPHPVSELRAGIDALGAGTLLQYDASHVLGLIAGKRFQQPLAEGADVVASSTHKTLGGPQGGLVLTNSSFMAEAVGRALQPGLLSNHHLHRIPALCQTLSEWRERNGEAADRIVHTAQAVAAFLEREGVPVVASHLGYTASHTILIPVKQFGPADQLALELETANIMVSACRLPGKLGPEGLRLGTQEMVQRGMLAEDADEVAAAIGALLRRKIDLEEARNRVITLARKMEERSKASLREAGGSHA